MYESGNASIAARRGRLLDGPSLRRLVEAGSAAELLVLLERAEDWRPILREVAPLAADPQSAFEVSVERHRSARLGALPRWYAPPARGLVEALVLPLDAPRRVALLRRGPAAGARAARRGRAGADVRGGRPPARATRPGAGGRRRVTRGAARGRTRVGAGGGRADGGLRSGAPGSRARRGGGGGAGGGPPPRGGRGARGGAAGGGGG